MYPKQMTSTHHFSPAFNTLSSSYYGNQNKHRRSQSFQTNVVLNNTNNGNYSNQLNNNKDAQKLPSIVELKPFNKRNNNNHNKRSQSFQINNNIGNRFLKSRGTRKLLSTNTKQQPITNNTNNNNTNNNMNVFLIDGTLVQPILKRKRKQQLNGNRKLNTNKVGFLSMTQQIEFNGINLGKSVSLGVKGNNYKHNLSLLSPKESSSSNTYEYPMDILTMINHCAEAKFTLAFLCQNFNRHTAQKVLCHPKITQNPGWFHRFINSQNKDGNTALHILCMIGDLELSQILISCNVLVNVLNHDRKTALDLAMETNDCKVIEILLKHRAIPGPSYYEQYLKYESKLSVKAKSLLSIYLDQRLLIRSSMINKSENKNDNNTDDDVDDNIYHFTAPTHLYEKPLAFKHQQYSTSDLESLNDVVSEVSSTKCSTEPTSPSNGYFFNSTADNFFNSYVDFNNKL